MPIPPMSTTQMDGGDLVHGDQGCELERKRQRNIERNKQALIALGLVSNGGGQQHQARRNTQGQGKQKNRWKRTNNVNPSRRSKRLRYRI